MKKLNRNYLSFFEGIGLLKPDPKVPAGYGPHYYRYHDGSDNSGTVVGYLGDRYPDYIYIKFQFLGSLRPFYKMTKDFLDTFRPYYSAGKIKRDLLQPIRGIGNFLQGVASILGGIVMTVGLVILTPFIGWIPVINMMILPKVIYPISWIIEGIANMVRGLTQVVTSPLVYLFKVPLRALLTRFQKEPKYAEDKPEIKRLSTEMGNKLPKINICQELPILPFEKTNDPGECDIFIKEAWSFRPRCDLYLMFNKRLDENIKREAVQLNRPIINIMNSDELIIYGWIKGEWQETCLELSKLSDQEQTNLLSFSKMDRIIKEQDLPELLGNTLRRGHAGSYRDTEEKNLQCNSNRQELTSLLYEAHRKYNKSVKDGWKTRLDGDKVSSLYESIFPFFKKVTNMNLTDRFPDKWHKADNIPEEKEQAVRSYLANFQ